MRVACVSCGRPTDHGVKCDECKKASPANERPYDDAEWKRRSAAFLRRHPWCVVCQDELGLSIKATVADHYPETRKELLAKNVDDPDAARYLRPLCVQHHATHGRKTTIRFDNDPA